MDQYTDYLAHHGVLGMKWGVRRYQNKDGSLTPRGAKRYALDDFKKKRDESKAADRELKRTYQDDKTYATKALTANRKNFEKIEAKAKYAKTLHQKDSKAIQNRSEMNMYAKEMYKTGGMRGSLYDEAFHGRSSYAYAQLKAKKGKKYADAVEKKMKHRAYASLAGSTALLAGTVFVTACL